MVESEKIRVVVEMSSEMVQELDDLAWRSRLDRSKLIREVLRLALKSNLEKELSRE